MRLNPPIRLTITDDHEIFRKGFKTLLQSHNELEVVGEAGNGKELLELLVSVKPDIAFVDIRMPVMDGVAACRTISEQFPGTQVIALSMFNDDELIVNMLKAGARGYLLKNTNSQEIFHATQTVYAGHSYYCSSTSSRLNFLAMQGLFHSNRRIGSTIFTTREIEIIQLMCEQYSSKEIADKLGISSRTVETHRQKLQEKTGSRNSYGILIYAIKYGLVKI